MRRVLLVLVVLLQSAQPIFAWWGDGHGVMTRAAIEALPESLPAFFREGSEQIVHCAYDPELAKNRAVPHLSAAEHGEHFFDVELLDQRTPPETRSDFIRLCAEAGLDPNQVGFLPYAVAERTERLALALAEYRHWPDNDQIKAKTLVHAGLLAQYAQNLAQPLLLTIHFDGRVDAEGNSPQSGISHKMNSLIERVTFAPGELSQDLEVAPVVELMPEIFALVEAGRKHIDQVYALEGQLDDASAEAVRAFAVERARAAVQITLRLYLRAWHLSEGIEFEGWLKR